MGSPLGEVKDLEVELYAVIMAGGVGTRLWPRSRQNTPKQFLDIVAEKTMFQETFLRIEPLVSHRSEAGSRYKVG